MFQRVSLRFAKEEHHYILRSLGISFTFAEHVQLKLIFFVSFLSFSILSRSLIRRLHDLRLRRQKQRDLTIAHWFSWEEFACNVLFRLMVETTALWPA